MKSLFILVFFSFVSIAVIQSCKDEFNDPNPKGGIYVENDSVSPQLTLFKPAENGLYADSTRIFMQISDSFNLKSVSVEIASLDASVTPFLFSQKPASRFFQLDTMYFPGVLDTTSFQMLVQASDSTGNILAKTVNFKMH